MQLLSGQGFKEVYNLAGGIKAWRGEVASGPVDAGLELVSGGETPTEMLTIAFGMEEGMRQFYERLSQAAPDPDAAALFGELSELEVGHKQAVYDLYRARGGELETMEALQERASEAVMEGGLDPAEMFDAIRPTLGSAVEILSYVMMLETQSLDLYLRMSPRSADPATAEILLDLANQERKHLELMGELLEKRVRPS